MLQKFHILIFHIMIHVMSSKASDSESTETLESTETNLIVMTLKFGNYVFNVSPCVSPWRRPPTTLTVGDREEREEVVYAGEDDAESIAAEDVQPVCTLKICQLPSREELEDTDSFTVHTAVGVMNALKAQAKRTATAMSRATPLR